MVKQCSWQREQSEEREKRVKKGERTALGRVVKIAFCSSNIPVTEGGLAFHFLVSAGD